MPRGVIKAGDIVTVNHLKSLGNIFLKKNEDYME